MPSLREMRQVVLIVKNGKLIAERHSEDRTANDLVTSWSVAKSFTSALLGAAVDEGYLIGLDQELGDFLPSGVIQKRRKSL